MLYWGVLLYSLLCVVFVYDGHCMVRTRFCCIGVFYWIHCCILCVVFVYDGHCMVRTRFCCIGLFYCIICCVLCLFMMGPEWSVSYERLTLPTDREV